MQLFSFTPSHVGGTVPFTFGPVIDGSAYDATVTFNIGGRRYYITLANPNGVLVFHMALVGSPVGQAIETLDWQNGWVLATTVVPFSLRVGKTYDLVIRDCIPDGFNGKQRCLITGPQSFAYPLPVPPGPVLNVGVVTFDLDLLAGYGFLTTMVYRDLSRLFEVNP